MFYDSAPNTRMWCCVVTINMKLTFSFLFPDSLHPFVCRAYDEIAALPSIEHTIRVGTSDVEMVVQAANNV